MSQDILSEFDSLYQPPRAPAPSQPSPAPPPPPQHHGRRRGATATTFDDLLGIMDTGLKSNPRPPQHRPVSALQHQERQRRPVSLHGTRSFGRPAAPMDPYSSGLFDIGPQRGTATSDLYANDGFDDFGSFETARSGSRRQSAAMGMGLGLGGFETAAPRRPSASMSMGLGGFEAAAPRGPSVAMGMGSFDHPPPPPRRPSAVRGHSHSQSLFEIFGPSAPVHTPSPPPPVQQQFWQQRPSPGLLDLRPPPPIAPDVDDDFGDFVTSPITTPEPQKAFGYRPPPRSQSAQPPPPAAPASPSIPHQPARTSLPPAPAPAQFRTSPAPAAHGISLHRFATPPKPLPPPPPEQFPPVAALLQTLSPLFLLPQEKLLDSLKGLPFPLRQRVLSHPKTRQFLEGVCEFGRVAGRIIAGRKRRARVGGGGAGAGGMKLGAGGGPEVQKEEREVKEACRIWKEGTGRLKAATAGAVPEIDEEWKGVWRGGQACKLCKLGKGELVPALKEQKDKAGWWDERWGGHASCRGFWERYGGEVRRGGY
ncbi:hypothetical protein BZA05DRAFT_395732 [Tricharina praecox]|uniref:uncharacterized protein n=1 Tax=Tricharina praecox TaxID=43433 RepID=UPI00221FA80A|nr:uncharacterized protein BZA05DRAFT_395732 [Tricharina praecox]KAI5853350.1 hypothetical protein BZA05DRAFT_395732 [Tricharina praecox]